MISAPALREKEYKTSSETVGRMPQSHPSIVDRAAGVGVHPIGWESSRRKKEGEGEMDEEFGNFQE